VPVSKADNDMATATAVWLLDWTPFKRWLLWGVALELAHRKIALHCDHRMIRRHLEKLMPRVAQSWIELGYELDAAGEAVARARDGDRFITQDWGTRGALSRYSCAVDGSFLAGPPPASNSDPGGFMVFLPKSGAKLIVSVYQLPAAAQSSASERTIECRNMVAEPTQPVCGRVSAFEGRAVISLAESLVSN